MASTRGQQHAIDCCMLISLLVRTDVTEDIVVVDKSVRQYARQNDITQS